MHRIELPADIRARVLKRYGTLHVHSDLNPTSTALIVVDLQNAFMVEELAAVYVPQAVEIVPNVNRLADAVRRSGGKVCFLRHTHTKEILESWQNYFDLGSSESRKQRLARSERLSEGDVGHELHPSLMVAPEDKQVCKTRFSAFIHDSSNLHEILQQDGIDTLLIAGAVSNVCCESTARDAMMLNYKVIMISDANAALSDDEHIAALANIYNTFGDVMTTDETIMALQGKT